MAVVNNQTPEKRLNPPIESDGKGSSAHSGHGNNQNSFSSYIQFSGCRGANSEEKNQIRVTPIRAITFSSSASMQSGERSSGYRFRNSSMECSSMSSFQDRRKNTVQIMNDGCNKAMDSPLPKNLA